MAEQHAATRPDRRLVERRVAEVSDVMRTHAGAIELVDVADDGAVTVAFTGMCQGCRFRPLTLYGTIVPALTQVPGVRAVHVRGARISEEAAARMAAAFPPTLPGAASG